MALRMARLATKLSELDIKIIDKMKAEAQKNHSQTISLDLNEFIKQGYSLEKIQESLSFLSNLDARELEEESFRKLIVPE
jgi:hypothetical protein